jgi:hypothetical protein
MSLHTVTLKIPENTYYNARNVAKTSRRPVEDILLEAIDLGLSPLDDLPAGVMDELKEFVFLSDAELWQIARRELSSTHPQQMDALLAKKGQGKITPEEQAKLDKLLEDYQTNVLRRGQAAVLLQRRGYDMSNPAVLKTQA